MSVEEGGGGEGESGRGTGLSDCDVDDGGSEAGKSTCSSSQPFSPNPSESEDLADYDGKRGKGRRRADGSSRISTYPMSERQQMALLKQITAPGLESESPKSPVQTPGSAGRLRGKKIHRRNEKGETALHICARKGEYSQCRRLLQEGADVNSVDYAGWTSLHEAANHGWYKTARVLLKGGANVNACASTSGDTPLHDAVASGRKKLVILFLRHGAAKEIMNNEGKRPIDCVDPDNENEEIRRILRGEVNVNTGVPSSSEDEDFSDVDSVSTMSPKCFQSTPTHSSQFKPKVLSLDDTPPGIQFSPASTSSSMPSVPVQHSLTSSMLSSSGLGVKRDGPMHPPSVIVDMTKKKQIEPHDAGGLSPGTAAKKGPDVLNVEKSHYKSLSVAISESEGCRGGVSFSPLGDQDKVSPRVVLSPLIPSPTPSSTGSSSMRLSQPTVPKGPGVTPPQASPLISPTTPVSKRRTPAVKTAFSPQAAAVRRLRKREQLGKRQPSFKPASPAKKPRRLDTRTGKTGRAPGGHQGPVDVYEFPDSDSELDSPEVTELTLKSFVPKQFPTAPAPDPEPTPEPLMKTEASPPAAIPPQTPPEKPKPLMDIKSEVLEDDPITAKGKEKDILTRVEELSLKREAEAVIPEKCEPLKEESKKDAPEQPELSEQYSKEEEEPMKKPEIKEVPVEVKEEESRAPKVPPLRIIISRSGSDEEVASEASGGVSRQPNSGHPYVVKQSEDTGSESGSGPKEGSTVSTAHPGRVPGKGGGREPTQRMTRSKVKQEGVKLEPGVAYINTRTNNINEEGTSATGGNGGANIGAGHPKKRIARRTVGGAVEAVGPTSQFQPHWSQSSTASQTASIVSKNSYQAYKSLRVIVENKWNTGATAGPYEPPRDYNKFMISKKDYLLQRNFKKETQTRSSTPQHLDKVMSDLFVKQEEVRNGRRLQQRLERERLILACEREVLRIHARDAYKGEQLPLSAVRVFRDAEMCNPLELDRPSLLSPNTLSAQESQLPLQSRLSNLLAKFQRRKVELIGRQRMEAQGLQAEQQMTWESQLRKSKLLDFFQAWKPNSAHVPAVQVVEDFDLLPPQSESLS